MFDPSAQSIGRFRAYGPAKLPCDRDRDIEDFVDQLRAGGPPAVARVLKSMSEPGRQVLRAYAERMASLAVRTRDSTYLLRALIAVVLGGLDDYSIEALMVMPLIEDSAGRIGVEAQDLFQQAADVVGHPGTVNLVRWLSRLPEDRTLKSMGFREGSDDGGFRYRRDW